MKIDSINKQIINILQEDGSITNSELANRIGLSPASTIERVRKLEKEGIIRKYCALIDHTKIGKDVIVFVEIVNQKHDREGLSIFIEAIKDVEEVLECYHISGDSDFLLKVLAKDIADYERIALEKLAVLPNLARIRSHFVLSPVKVETRVTI
jgi:Lrp/AsnC family transcriptional regulator, leucine-responsive regulatory protein